MKTLPYPDISIRSPMSWLILAIPIAFYVGFDCAACTHAARKVEISKMGNMYIKIFSTFLKMVSETSHTNPLMKHLK